ncbi:MAG TPA: YggS family pyridoxal phosphate-dependent enzyme [Alphaproteobacteria bacterium]|nr:YggS family pyridoxal phosphate-dependent enzyme [Alphaproteobacteria bacterium]
MTQTETPIETKDVASRLAAVEERIAVAARDAGRDPKDVTLVAVSKGHEVATIRPALEAGHRIFGENRVQEAQAKWPALKQAFPDTRLHLIGPLQTNKARDALELFDVIETVDRPRLAAKLWGELDRHPDLAARGVRFFVQVNTGEEPQKAGVLPSEADALIRAMAEDYNLPVTGLMCIPPVDEEPGLHFALLAKIAARNGIEALSMGMSTDFETAVTFGATHVRVGTAIFGVRPQHGPGQPAGR